MQRACVFVLALLLCGAQAQRFRSRLFRGPSLRGRAVASASSQSPKSADLEVPDVSSIDKSLLKKARADKFVALWHIFMRDTPSRVTEGPWTLFVPRNAALPPPGVSGFLSDQGATRRLLQQHAGVGEAVDPANPPPALASLGGGRLLLETKGGATYVNGVKLTGESFPAKNGVVIIIDGIIPLENSNAITTSSSNRRRRPTSVRTSDNVIHTTPRSNRRRRPVGPKKDVSTTSTTTTTTTAKPSRRRRPFVRRRFGPKRGQNSESTTLSTTPVTTSTTTTTPKPEPTVKPFAFKPVEGVRRSALLFSSKSRKFSSKNKNEALKRKDTSSIPAQTKFHKFKNNKKTLNRIATGRSLGKSTSVEISDSNTPAAETNPDTERNGNDDITPTVNDGPTPLTAEESSETIFEDEVQTRFDQYTETFTEKATQTIFPQTTPAIEGTTIYNLEQSTMSTETEPSSTDIMQSTTENYGETTDSLMEATTSGVFENPTTMTNLETTAAVGFRYTTPRHTTTEIVSDETTESSEQKGSLPEEAQVPRVEVDTKSDLEHVSELPLLSFNKFVKITTNGDKYFSENATKIEESHHEFDEDVEFIPDSAFVPFNKFLNSERVTGNTNSTFQLLVENPTHDNTNSSNFLDWLMKEIKSRKQLGGKEFLNHLIESGVAEELKLNTAYTALVPTDEAFYSYYPIDFGFNIFLVESFLRRTLREHLLAGSVVLEELEDGAQVPTLAGTTLTVSRLNGTLNIGGQPVMTESEVAAPQGRLYSLPQLLHVTPQTVSSLKGLYPHLETGPLLGGPWPRSQFLSHLLQRLESRPDTQAPSVAAFAALLAQSHVAHLAMPHDDEGRRLEYTALVPTDETLQTTLKGRRLSPEERNEFVASHILQGRLPLSPLPTSALSLLNQSLPVARVGDEVTVGGTTLLTNGESIYNLGAMFVVAETVTGPGAEAPVGDVPTAAPLTHRQPRVVTRTEYSISRRVNDGPELPVAAQ